MIAIDTDIMVYAHREDSAWHEAAFARIVELAEGRAPWAIPWPCVHEFLAIVTHPKIHAPPTPLASAIDQVEGWLEAPTLVLLSESGDYWRELRTTIEAGYRGTAGSRCAYRGAVSPAWRLGAMVGRSRLRALPSPENHESAGRAGRHRLIAESACTDAEALTSLGHYDFYPVGLVGPLRVVFPPGNLRFLGQFSVSQPPCSPGRLNRGPDPWTTSSAIGGSPRRGADSGRAA
jgi:predicted nucleic acid-binding protein